MNEWMQQHPASICGLVLWAISLLWLMPSGKPGKSRPGLPGVILAAAGVLSFCLSAGLGVDTLQSEVMFWTFAVTALLCAALMITSKNPVYGALWFALATLGTCGLFMLQSAPFLAAATIIVYAGAVIVTFLFVIMLARQSGSAGYDQKSQNTVVACLAAFLLIGAITKTLQTKAVDFNRPTIAAAAGEEQSGSESTVSEDSEVGTVQASAGQSASGQPMTSNSVQLADPAQLSTASSPPEPVPNYLSKADATTPVGSLRGLGRSLFSDYLFAVELAGTLLLVASIGAIAIAPRREEGAL